MDKLSRIIVLFFGFLLFGALGFGVLTEAGSGDNISGFAWSENIGWVSFNSTSDGSPISYGVNLNLDTGDLSGQAWSEHIGWISFNRADTGNPPASPFNGGSGPIAQYNFDTGQLTGWFRVLAYSGGWDGWIKFYNATVDANGDWHGWAWTDTVGGWLSFNSSDSGAGGSAYKVTMAGGINRPPSASGLEVVKGDYCATPAHYFSWTYSDPDGDTESQFQFQVDNNSDFSSPEIDRNYSGLSNPNPTTNNQTVVVAVSPTSDQIGYNTTYYWRVKVWDSLGADSGWVEGSSLTTEEHRYPSIDFNWSPTGPSQDEDVVFSDQSTVYGGATKSTWSWTFEDGNPAVSGEQNPTIQFTAVKPAPGNQVTLEITDSDGFYCENPKYIGVQTGLPGWQEILPQ